MQTGEVEANLVTLNQQFQLSYLPDLIAQKQTGTETEVLGNINLAFHGQEYKRLCQCLEAASQNSYLQDASSAKAALHDLLVRVRLEAIAVR